MYLNELEKDQIVIVRSWWRKPKGEPTRCRVHHVSHTYGLVDVIPLEGNTHMRGVRLSDILSIEEHHVF